MNQMLCEGQELDMFVLDGKVKKDAKYVREQK